MYRALSLAGLLIAQPAIADDRVPYKRNPISQGYKDKVVGDHSWKVEAIVRTSKPPASAEKMAMYRAAELALADGRTMVRVISYKSDALTMGTAAGGSIFSFSYGYAAELTFTSTNAPDPKGHCAKDIALSCTTFDAATAMVEFRPFLKFKGEK
jgi:hypothetical protein